MRSFIAGLLCLITLTALDAQIFRRGTLNNRDAPRSRAAAAVLLPAGSARLNRSRQVSKLDKKVDGHVGYNSGEVAEHATGHRQALHGACAADDWQTRTSTNAPRLAATVKSWLENEPRLIRYRHESKFSFLTDSDPGFRGLRTLLPADQHFALCQVW
jgi:hypothetical protein